MPAAHWSTSRRIFRRIEIKGVLLLHSPASFGGDGEGITDMPLLRDALEGRALLPGASIAGALRAFLWEREMGFECMFNKDNCKHPESLACLLFGGAQADRDGLQSALIIDDALGERPQTELRDGVAIDPTTRTAADDKKFDLELLAAGTRFPLHFEVLIGEPTARDNRAASPAARAAHEMRVRHALALALGALEQPGSIALGRRKRRGFGECSVATWQVREWDLTTACGLVDYLNGAGSWSLPSQIDPLLFPPETANERPHTPDPRTWLEVATLFALESSLLVRSGTGEIESGPDALHLHRLEAGRDKPIPILPGTSLAGALRARCLRVAQTLHGVAGAMLVESLFGTSGDKLPSLDARREQLTSEKQPTASRIEVRESIVQGELKTRVQTRIRQDHFTGGVLDSMLFEEAPLFGGAASRLALNLRLRQPSEEEVGLLLQALKDLWLADLPVGGDASIGRGRLMGLEAILRYSRPPSGSNKNENNGDANKRINVWRFSQSWDGVTRGPLQIDGADADELEKFAQSLLEWRRPPTDAEPIVAKSKEGSDVA